MIVSRFDADLGMMVHTGTDSVTLADLIGAVQSWFGHPEFDRRTPVVWNIGDAYLAVSIEELKNVYSATRSSLPTKRDGGRTAWVHPSGLVRSFLTIIGNEFDWGSEWGVFDDVGAAIQWCREQP